MMSYLLYYEALIFFSKDSSRNYALVFFDGGKLLCLMSSNVLTGILVV